MTFVGWSASANLSPSTCTGTTNPCSAVFGANPALTVTFNLKAGQTITVTTPAPASATYGSSFPVAATATSGLPVAITTTGGCSVGSGGSGSATINITSSAVSCVVHYNQAGNGTYNAAPEVTSTTTAAKAALTVTADADPSDADVDGFSKTYNGLVYSPFTVRYSGFVNGETAAVLTGTLSFSGAGATAVDAGGPYTVTPGGLTSANYLITFGNGSLTITKATAVVVVVPYTVTYDGSPHTATVTSITGVSGETGATVGTVDVSNTTHTAAGTYNTDSWSFTGTANYNDIAATTITDTINKATAVVVVAPYTVSYDGSPHSATVTSITGVNGETGATVGTVDVSNTTHTAAGTYNTDSWSFTGTANYNDIAATTITDTINKATAVVMVAPYTVSYDGSPHSATVTSITGVNGETGATVGTVDVSNTTHTAAGTYNTDSWSFTGTANYNDIAATTITDTINKATAVVIVSAVHREL